MTHDSRFIISNTLCGYFWQVVWALVKAVALICACCLVVFGALSSAVALFYPILQIYIGFDLSIATVSTTLWGITSQVLWNNRNKIPYKWAHKDFFGNSKRQVSKHKKPNILLEYLKAKKDKVCPIIEIED